MQLPRVLGLLPALIAPVEFGTEFREGAGHVEGSPVGGRALALLALSREARAPQGLRQIRLLRGVATPRCKRANHSLANGLARDQVLGNTARFEASVYTAEPLQKFELVAPRQNVYLFAHCGKLFACFLTLRVTGRAQPSCFWQGGLPLIIVLAADSPTESGDESPFAHG